VYILILEDDDSNRSLFRLQAEEVDFEIEVEVAWNGRDGLARMARRRPDLVVMDLGMPVLDGIGVLERISEWDDPQGAPPIVIVTARDLSPGESARLRSLGMTHAFQKGRYDTQMLVDAIAAHRPRGAGRKAS